MRRIIAYAVVTLALVAAGVLVSARIDLTTFTPGTPILAEEVNTNFEAITSAIEELQSLPSVRSLNTLAGELSLVAGDNIALAVNDASGEITITSTAEGTAGGDITGVTAGTGLAGGAQSGDVTMRIASSYRLPQACSSGSIPEWDGTVWTCGVDGVGLDGDITSVTAGVGLTGGGEAGDIELSVSFAGDGSEDSAARSDHHHLGETWQGANPLILDVPVFDRLTGVLELRNTGDDGAGLLVSDSGNYGVHIRSSQYTGLVIDDAGDKGIYAFGASFGAELHGREAGLLVGGTVSTPGGSDIVPDIILSGNSCSPCGPEDDDGRIYSEPRRSSSDIFLVSNDAVIVQLDADNNESGHFQVQDHTGAAVFQVAEDGEVRVNGAIVHGSDRALKRDVVPVDGREILERLVVMPIHRWTFRADETASPHVGPMAQDFHAAFGLGNDERYIGAVDADGVALAAIQGLYELVRERDAVIAEQERRLDALAARLVALEAAPAPPSE